MPRYELKLQLTTDLEPEKIKQVISSIEKSGKVKMHWIRSTLIKEPGRPNEVRGEIIEALENSKKPRSAMQLSKLIHRQQTSLYKYLHELERDGLVDVITDERWHVKRYALKG